jgi:hypothetical protein
VRHLLHPDSITGVPKFKTRAAEIRYFLEQNPQVFLGVPRILLHFIDELIIWLCLMPNHSLKLQVTHFVILDDRVDAADAELLAHFIQVHYEHYCFVANFFEVFQSNYAAILVSQFQTDPSVGLTDGHVAQALELLKP